jgi:hypothetical protein
MHQVLKLFNRDQLMKSLIQDLNPVIARKEEQRN